MIDQIFCISQYTLNVYAIPVLISSLAILFLGFVIFVRKPFAAVSMTFAIVTVTIFIWLFSAFWIYSSIDPAVAIFWTKCTYCGVCFIPAAHFSYSCAITRNCTENTTSIILSWLICALFLSLVFSTDLLINGLYHYQYGFYARFGNAAPLFLFYFAVMSFRIQHIYMTEYKKYKVNTVPKYRLRRILLASAIAYLGSFDFLGSFGIEIYPIGHIPVIVSLIIFAFTIWRYDYGYITPSFAADQIISTMKDALLVIDGHGIIRVMNKSAAKLLADNCLETGNSFTNITQDKHFLNTLSLLLKSKRKNIQNYEISYHPIHGTETTLSISTSIIFDQYQQQSATICILRNITKLKQVENELNKHRNNLEMQVITRTKSLAMTNVKLLKEIAERKQIEVKLKRSQLEMRNLSAYLQNIREKERTTIAREIHDELGQILTALHFDVDWLQKRLNSDQKLLVEKTQAMDKHIERSVESIHKIISELRPGVLDHLSLSDAIKWQTNEFMTRTGIQCKLIVTPQNIILTNTLATAIFRILQETLTNVIRHSLATKVRITLHRDTSTIKLSVHDNGTGISKKNILRSDAFGIIGIRERVNIFNGHFHISGSPEEGTLVTVIIPLVPGI